VGVSAGAAAVFSVGGGLETAISTNTTLGLEYHYTKFADREFGCDLGDL
jgi:outer membrane immunogenic protein